MRTAHQDFCVVELYPHDHAPLVLDRSVRPNPVTGFSFSQSIQPGSYAGQFTIHLRWGPGLKALCGGQRLDEVVGPDTWVIVRGLDYGVDADLVLGMVDRVFPAERLADGALVRTFEVVCSTFGKAIDRTEVWFCEFGEKANWQGRSMLELLTWSPTGSPDVLCKELVDGFLAPRTGLSGQWALPDSLAAALHIAAPGSQPGISAILDTSTWVVPTRGCGIVTNTLGTTYNLGQLLNEYSNPILNETFFDLREDASGAISPAMIHRERPWPVYGEDPITSPWQSLPTVVIPRAWIGPTDLALDAGALFNVFALLNEANPGTPLQNYALLPPVQAAQSVLRHGQRKFEVGSRFASFLYGGNAATEPNRWLWLLASWQGINHRLRAGTAAFRGLVPAARLGRRVVLMPPSGVEAETFTGYVSGIGLQWSPPPGGWRTTLILERGYWGGLPQVYGYLAELFDDLQSLDPASAASPRAGTVQGMEPTEGLLPPFERGAGDGSQGRIMGRRVGL